ncbi:hypothetical protein J6590_049746 [Homalodisca vitripennis]|nr:hypothetical protein J6590_049746 [Homalodisca vitripennis]
MERHASRMIGLYRGHFAVSAFLRSVAIQAQKLMCNLNVGNLMDVQERPITSRKRRDSGVEGRLLELVGFIPYQKLLLNKGVPTACCDWRGWFGAGLPFFPGDMTLGLEADPTLYNLTHPARPVTPEAKLRLL